MRVFNAWLDQVRARPFAWGSHDCLTFTNEGWRRIHGRGWADDWLGRYMVGDRPMTRRELRAEFGFATFDAAISSRLRPVDHVPPRGALVRVFRARTALIGLGIAIGQSAVFVGHDGLVFRPVDAVAAAWVQP